LNDFLRLAMMAEHVAIEGFATIAFLRTAARLTCESIGCGAHDAAP
jgi:hypothetical protein